MEEEIKKNQNLHQCKECDLHYKDKNSAEKCEAWCKEHKTCNVEITKQAEENKKDDSNLQSELEKKCEEYLNNWKRSAADFINYKKDEVERMGILAKYAKEDIILKILPILDSFYLAEKQLPKDIEKLGQTSLIEWTKGFLQIENQIEEFLKKEGIEEIKTKNPSTGSGLKFNPETMETIGEITNSQFSIPNTVVEELQKGYKMRDKVIRPARVKISK